MAIGPPLVRSTGGIFRLITANFWESSPGPVKCVMAMMGRLKENYRLPIVPVTPATRAKLKTLAEELGLLSNL